MKRSCPLFLVLALLAGTATTAQSQVSVSAGAAYAEALDGKWGVDGRLSFDFPVFPLGVFAGADYFWTSCDEDCSLWGWNLGGKLRLPFPIVSPYVTGALVGRKWERGSESLDTQGMSAGVGADIKFALKLFGEVNREFLGDDLDQWVIKVGLRI